MQTNYGRAPGLALGDRVEESRAAMRSSFYIISQSRGVGRSAVFWLRRLFGIAINPDNGDAMASWTIRVLTCLCLMMEKLVVGGSF